MTTLLQPERDIGTALDDLASRWQANNRQPIVGWTADVKKVLHEAAAGRYEVRASSYPLERPGYGEWLYDLTWINRNAAGQLIEVVLACESEWNTVKRKIDEDFQKLLAAKATIRLMVFEQGTLRALTLPSTTFAHRLWPRATARQQIDTSYPALISAVFRSGMIQSSSSERPSSYRQAA